MELPTTLAAVFSRSFTIPLDLYDRDPYFVESIYVWFITVGIVREL
jgi:hypothetical protein